MRSLQVIRSAYRCTIEEQDDPALWIGQAMRNAGMEVSVLLSGNAVNYAVRGQDASGLSFGGRSQTRPADLERDVAALTTGDSRVFVVAEDMIRLGLNEERLVGGVEILPRAAVAGLYDEFETVWHW